MSQYSEDATSDREAGFASMPIEIDELPIFPEWQEARIYTPEELEAWRAEMLGIMGPNFAPELSYPGRRV